MSTERNKAARHARYALRRKINGRLVAVEATTEHGTPSTYGNWGCRCEPCTEAHREYTTAMRRARYAGRRWVGGRLVHPDAKHGVPSSSVNYGCRCKRCSEANTAARKDFEWRKKNSA